MDDDCVCWSESSFFNKIVFFYKKVYNYLYLKINKPKYSPGELIEIRHGLEYSSLGEIEIYKVLDKGSEYYQLLLYGGSGGNSLISLPIVEVDKKYNKYYYETPRFKKGDRVKRKGFSSTEHESYYVITNIIGIYYTYDLEDNEKYIANNSNIFSTRMQLSRNCSLIKYVDERYELDSETQFANKFNQDLEDMINQ